MIICAISTLIVNNIGFYFPTFDDRILGPLIEFLFNHKYTEGKKFSNYL